MDNIRKWIPYYLSGKVVKGFGRGSKQLGIPTANISEDVVEQLPHEVECGIYFGWANVDCGQVYKMVMSIGWNPFYKNKKKSVEVHIIHTFQDDFYDSVLKTVMLGYIRQEKDFSSLDELISAIRSDIQNAENILEEDKFKIFKDDPFFNIKV